VVSPVHNEQQHLDRTAAAIAAQQRPPDRWIIIDDRSTDATLEIARRWERELEYLTVMRAPDPELRTGRDGLALARDARAFNHAVETSGPGYTHISKLDGDVELPPDWYAGLLETFAERPDLGIAGGRLAERDARGWRRIPIPDDHVHGAVKIYTRECLKTIGGIPERLGWDTIDETYARMHGLQTWSVSSLVGYHHRPWGSANGRLRGRARHGECAWILHQPAYWIVGRSMKLARGRPFGLTGIAFAFGYVRAAARGVPRVDDVAFRTFVRAELRGRVAAKITRGRRTRRAAGSTVASPR
jgi:hypothetical protein